MDEISWSKRTMTTLEAVHYAGSKDERTVVQRHKMEVRLSIPICLRTLNEQIREMHV